MSFKPNRYGICPTGELTVVASGTAVQLTTNYTLQSSPNDPITVADPVQYALSWADIIINSPPSNQGGLYLVSYNLGAASGSKNLVDTILLYVPQGSGPVSVKKFLGGSLFNPNSYAIDSDQSGDKAWVMGVGLS